MRKDEHCAGNPGVASQRAGAGLGVDPVPWKGIDGDRSERVEIDSWSANFDGVSGAWNRTEPRDASKRSGGGSDSCTQRFEMESLSRKCRIGACSRGIGERPANFFRVPTPVEQRAAAARGVGTGARV